MRLRPPRASRTTTSEYGEVYQYSGWGALGPWLWPVAVGPVLFALAWMLHAMWGGNPWAQCAVTVSVLMLTTLTWRAGRARGPMVRGVGTAAVAAASTWVLAAVIAGPFTHPTGDLFLMIWFVGTASAWLMRSMRGAGHDGQGWQELGDYLGLPGSRTMSTRGDGQRIRTVVEVAPGEQTHDDVITAAPRIASKLGVPMSGVRVQPDPDNARRANVTIVTRDLLKDPIPWPGPSAAAASIAEPLVLGVRENGDPLQLWLPGDERSGRSATSVLITGMTGSGKSVAGRLILAEAIPRCDVEVWLVDTVKGAQFIAPFRGHAAQLATTPEATKALIAGLPGLISDRANELGERGYDQWVAGCGMPFIIVHVEEAAAVAKSRAFVQVAQTGRSAGVVLVWSLQRATHENLPTDLRAQLGAVIAFGCRPGDERFGLSRETVEAGAAPQRWGNTRPGYNYAEIPGTDLQEWHAPARTFLATAAQVRDALGPGVVQEPAREPEPDVRSLIRMRIDALHMQGTPELRPADLMDLVRAGGRSQAWLSGELAQLVDAGVLFNRQRGVYGFAP